MAKRDKEKKREREKKKREIRNKQRDNLYNNKGKANGINHKRN